MAASTSSAPARAARILTRKGIFIDDFWTVLDSAEEARADRPALLPLADYLAQSQPTAHGVWLAPTDNAATLDPHLATLLLIAVRFPSFGDGRGYSIAALLRRSGYRADLRAIGDVLVDQLHMLRRVGFTSFALRADQAVRRQDCAQTLFRPLSGRLPAAAGISACTAAGSSRMNAAPILWQRSRPKVEPVGFAGRVKRCMN
jgi:uncharacterized protein (DUF934 family)